MTTAQDFVSRRALRTNRDPVRSGLEAEVAQLRADLAAQTQIAGEYAHRNRNLLAVVAALGRRALAAAPDMPAARAEFNALMQRLAAGQAAADADGFVHDAARSPAPPRDLRVLARDVLGGFEDGAGPRATLSGPPVCLVPMAARVLALVLHELGTNALKHGALAQRGGRIRLDWWRMDDGSLCLGWQETGVPMSLAPGGPPGGGTALFAAFAGVLDGRLTPIPSLEGFAVELVLPACHLREASIPAAPEVAAGVGSGSAATADWQANARGVAVVPRRVLVVEDSALIAEDLAEMVRGAGCFDVTLALSLEEAVVACDAAGAAAFDLVLLDVGLGSGTAEDLMPLIDRRRVLLVSGRSAEELPGALHGLPLLAKPFQPDAVARAVAQVLSGSAHSIE